jgi:hypothetical protein
MHVISGWSTIQVIVLLTIGWQVYLDRLMLKQQAWRKRVNSFKLCGIYPFDRDVFDESEFAPALMTDRDMPQDI